MNGVVRSVGSLFSSGQFSEICEPDHAPQFFVEPPLDFVLCRDKSGKATAIYGDAVWDLNPYRLSARKIVRINFDKVFNEKGAEQQALVEEVKYILYCMIYFAGGGRLGALSAKTLGQYWGVLRICMKFCLEQKLKSMVGVLSLQQLFTNPAYLGAFINQKKFERSVFSGVLGALNRVGGERLGYAVLSPANFDLKKLDSKQHPVIPTRIYLNMINVAADLLEQIYQGVDRYESFLMCFADEHYGVNQHVQICRGIGGRAFLRPGMSQALEMHGLASVFTGDFSCSDRRFLQESVRLIQYLTKVVIHLYTGMRDQEVMRMSYDCLSESVARKSIVDRQDVERDKSLAISILSTTTKFTGYKQEGAWFASSEVVKAIKVAQAICRGLAKLYKVDLGEHLPLFANPSVITYEKASGEVNVSDFTGPKYRALFGSLTIDSVDLQELALSDPSRDFLSEPEFAVGQPWPLTSHQFRRSLAFYGASSGFISLPTLRAQFKHMTIEMSRYYANHYSNLRTVFGYYDDNKKGFVLPCTHFAFEYQMAMPMAVANQLIADLLLSEEPLFGGTGSYAEKQKERVKAGEIQIGYVRADTERRVSSGAISYRPTLLGGCTKAGHCDSFLLGEYTECLSCEGAIIKPSKLDAAIQDAAIELADYEEGSCEYQILMGDIQRLTAFKARFIETVEDKI